jgi:molybdate transport system ATP-binding protein
MNRTLIIGWDRCKIQISTTLLLQNINFRVNEGEVWGIIGPNSSGKTILAKALTGLLPIYGNVHSSLAPHDAVFVSFHSEFKLKHGVSAYRQMRWNMPDPELVPTVRKQLSPIQNQDYLNELIGMFDFYPQLDRLVVSLSNGEQRKLELIKALAQKPRLLVIDNAFIGLDSPSRKLLSNMIDQLIGNGQTLVLTGLKPDDFPQSIKHFLLLKNQTANSTTKEKLPDLYPPQVVENMTIPRWEPSAVEEIISVKNLHLSYNGHSILQNVNWIVKPGEKWVLSGGNGSGKTSLLNMIFADNPKAFACDISLFGKPKGSGESIWEIKERIGFVSPEMHQYLPSRQWVNDVVCSGFFGSEGLYHKPTSFQRNLAQKWLQTVGLEFCSNRAFGELSSSAQRMILVLRTLVKNPPLLLLDEPFQGLDPLNIQKMKNLLNSLAAQTPCAMVFVTHFEDEIPGAFDYELRLHEGIVVFCGKRTGQTH